MIKFLFGLGTGVLIGAAIQDHARRKREEQEDRTYLARLAAAEAGEPLRAGTLRWSSPTVVMLTKQQAEEILTRPVYGKAN